MTTHETDHEAPAGSGGTATRASGEGSAPVRGSFPPLLMVGTDHRSSPLELRERVAYDAAAAEDLLLHLRARSSVAEAVALSTCNRTEFYVVPDPEKEARAGEADTAYRSVLDLAFLSRVPEMEREGRLRVLRDGGAARHMLAVASGLESMVLGEPEILGQVKQAVELAEAVGSSGPVIRQLLRCAQDAGARSRSETAISTGAVSLGYAVVELASSIFSGLGEVRVLVLGAGETGASVTRNLLERGATDVRLANRGRERAEALQRQHPAIRLISLEERFDAVGEADLVVTATSAPEPLLTRDHLKAAVSRRSSRPLLVVDLGVPRNVEVTAGRLPNLFLHSIDSLETLIERNLRKRRSEVPRVEEIVSQELDRFAAWHRSLEAEPLVARLQKKAERIRRQEMEGALRRFPEEVHDDLERFTRSLVRKILHNPSTRLRSTADGSQAGLHRLDLARELFDLDDESS